MYKPPSRLNKLLWSLPWLARYPFWRANDLVRRATESDKPSHLIITVGNHFEPSWREQGGWLDWDAQLARMDQWSEKARKIGRALQDFDGMPFRHTYFYPAEQYYAPLLDKAAELQSEGFGEVEVHLHHGLEGPDTEENLRRVLVEFRDALAEEHKCLSRMDGEGQPMYAFIHGNWALANSAGGRYCGVDAEMQILRETGCYADFTLPSAPDQSQVSRINAVYSCGHPLTEARPHRSGSSLRVGKMPTLPVIFTGPLVFDWTRRLRGLPIPRLDDGALAANYPASPARLGRWRSAHVSVRGRPEWVFIKLFSHGFFDHDQDAQIGDGMLRFLEGSLELAQRTRAFKLHFATARESFNIALAAVDGRDGEPGKFRDYRLRTIMQEHFDKFATMDH
jgi:hypothetical protein